MGTLYLLLQIIIAETPKYHALRWNATTQCFAGSNDTQ